MMFSAFFSRSFVLSLGLVAVMAGALGSTQPAHAGFAEGCQAFHYGMGSYRAQFAKSDTTEPDVDLGIQSFEQATKLWRQAAWMEDDLLSQYWLGLMYRNGINLNDLQSSGPAPDCVSQFNASDANPIGVTSAYTIYHERVEAAVWFFLAAINPIAGGQSALMADKRDEYRRSAAAALQQLTASFGTEELRDVEQRLQYVLSKRRAEGFLRLAEIYDKRSKGGVEGDGAFSVLIPETQSDLQKSVAGEEGGSSAGDSKQPFVCSVFGVMCKDTDTASSANDTSAKIEPLDQLKIERRTVQRSDSGAGSSVGDNNWDTTNILGLIVRSNNIDALTFYILAAKEGHPIARVLLGDLITEIGVNDSTIEIAENKANEWQPPFEYYPGGYDFYPLGHRDDWMTDWASVESLLALTEALERGDAQLNNNHILAALRVLSFKDKRKNDAVKKFQADIGEQQTGELTPLQTVKLMQKAGDTGNADSQLRLGVMHHNGWGLPKNLDQAKLWYELAAKQGVVEAHYNLHLVSEAEGNTDQAQAHLQQACGLNAKFVKAKGKACAS